MTRHLYRESHRTSWAFLHFLAFWVSCVFFCMVIVSLPPLLSHRKYDDEDKNITKHERSSEGKIVCWKVKLKVISARPTWNSFNIIVWSKPQCTVNKELGDESGQGRTTSSTVFFKLISNELNLNSFFFLSFRTFFFTRFVSLNNVELIFTCIYYFRGSDTAIATIDDGGTQWSRQQNAVSVRHAFKAYGPKSKPNQILNNLNMTVSKGTMWVIGGFLKFSL